MNWIDWLLLAIPVAALCWVGWKTQTYMHSVSGFLSGERCAGRYLLAVADGNATLGLISVIAMFQINYRGGFAIGYWSQFQSIVWMLIALSGFVVYRFRETRALTVAQFFEMRYSRGVRITAGFLAFISGLLNYAIFPAIAGRFMIYYCQIPESFRLFGVTIDTFGFLMAVMLSGALFIVVLGGQITTMVTDCLQGIFSYFIYMAVVIVILCVFSMADFETAALSRPEGMSYFNPYNVDKLSTFNILYVLIGVFTGVYAWKAWFGTQGYMTAAISPHEQKMAGVLGTWKNGFFSLTMTLIVLGAFTLMNNPSFAEQSAAVTAELNSRINLDTPAMTEAMRSQMLVPVCLRHILPHGLIGLFCALMIFLMVSTDTTYMHSWGSILAQDVILPIRGKPISEKAQILLIRCCIIFVAVFAWFFSKYFGQVDFVVMFQTATGTIWLGGAGCLLIGGLYCRVGNSAGAYTAMIMSCVLGTLGFLLIKFWEPCIYPWCVANIPETLESFRLGLEKLGNALPIVNWETDPETMKLRFPVSASELYLLTVIICIASYFIGSLLFSREKCNLEKILHRGEYAAELTEAEKIAIEQTKNDGEKDTFKKRFLDRIIGIDSEYTHKDRMLAWSVFLWTMWGFALWLFQLLCNAIFGIWSEKTWFAWFQYYTVVIDIIYGLATTIWFTTGGIRDLMRLFKALGKQARTHADNSDNGMVQ